jgi:hypothetical protein
VRDQHYVDYTHERRRIEGGQRNERRGDRDPQDFVLLGGDEELRHESFENMDHFLADCFVVEGGKRHLDQKIMPLLDRELPSDPPCVDGDHVIISFAQYQPISEISHHPRARALLSRRDLLLRRRISFKQEDVSRVRSAGAPDHLCELHGIATSRVYGRVPDAGEVNTSGQLGSGYQKKESTVSEALHDLGCVRRSHATPDVPDATIQQDLSSHAFGPEDFRGGLPFDGFHAGARIHIVVKSVDFVSG